LASEVIAVQLFIEKIAEPVVSQAETGMCRTEKKPERIGLAVMELYTILSPSLDL